MHPTLCWRFTQPCIRLSLKQLSCLAPPAEPNQGRGADLVHYSWTQTLGEVTVSVPVPPGTKGRSMDVAISKQHLRVGIKGQAPILDVSWRGWGGWARRQAGFCLVCGCTSGRCNP